MAVFLSVFMTEVKFIRMKDEIKNYFHLSSPVETPAIAVISLAAGGNGGYFMGLNVPKISRSVSIAIAILLMNLLTIFVADSLN